MTTTQPAEPKLAWAWLPSKAWGQWEVTLDPDRATRAREHGLHVVEFLASPRPGAAGELGDWLTHLTMIQNVAGAEGDWAEEFRQWYEPGRWIGVHRAACVFLGMKVKRGIVSQTQEKDHD